MKTPNIFLTLPLLAVSSLSAAPGDLIWSFDTGEIVYSSPAIGDLGEVVFGSENGRLYCLNPDRSLKWQFFGATDWIDSSPAIFNGTVYFGSWDNFFYALDLNDGSLKWSFETANLIIASPTVDSSGNVYVGSNDGIFYSFSPTGSINWFYGLTSGLAIDSSAALSPDQSTIYFGADDGTLYALNTSTGLEVWTYSLVGETQDSDIEINTSPAVGNDGTIYFGSRNSYLYALNPNGSLKWSFAATDGIDSSPAISSDGRILFASRDGYLYCLDAEGFQLWETLVGDVFYASPAINENNEVIIGGYAGSNTVGVATQFMALSVVDGSILWSFTVSGYNDSSPNIAPDGSIYVGSHDGNLYKLEGSSKLASSPWPRIHQNRQQTGNPDSNQNLSPIDYFPSLSFSLDEWFQVEWFGAQWIALSTLPYVYHINHEFIYLTPSVDDGIWFYDIALGWLYTSANFPNYYFNPVSNNWLLHESTSKGIGNRWFYDFSKSTFSTDGWFRI